MSSLFGDRFTRNNPQLQGVDIDSLSDSELLRKSSELSSMVDSIRRVDATLSRAKSKEIYAVITQYSDPKIGGILAAARDKNTGERLFTSVDQVKEVMFPPSEGEGSLDLVVFNDTIRQISVTLTASRLVGNLAPAGSNFRDHAEYLLKSAEKDLDRIIDTIDLTSLQQSPKDEQETRTGAALYFEPTNFALDKPLTMKVYVSGASTSWEEVETFEGETSTADIVSSLGDYINKLTSKNSGSYSPNLIAAPVLSGEDKTHTIFFEARRFSTTFSAELISVSFDQSQLPFKWGINSNNLSDYQINSLLIATGIGKVGRDSTSPLLDDKEGKPSVLYIRRKKSPTINQQDSYKFTVSPLMEGAKTVPFPRISSPDSDLQEQYDLERPSQFALSLISELNERKSEIQCLGAIIKNDPIEEEQPVVAVELVAYQITVDKVSLILDLLKIPTDLEVAIGDLKEPITSFSNQPRSVRVEAEYDSDRSLSALSGDNSDSPKVVRRPSSSALNQAREKIKNWENPVRRTPRTFLGRPPQY